MAQAAPAAQAANDAHAQKVLEFGLGDVVYCLAIDSIAEIVDAGQLTPIPNSPYYVDGVMDLRGRTTTIVDPKKLFDIDKNGDHSRILVFESEAVEGEGSVGWIVDDVYQVTDVDPGDIDKTTMANQSEVRGVIRADDRLVVWLEPNVGDGIEEDHQLEHPEDIVES